MGGDRRTRRFAALVRGVDGVFLDGGRRATASGAASAAALHLVPEGSPEEAWARAVFGPDGAAPYRCTKIPSNTEDLLTNSDVAERMRARGVDAFQLSTRCSPGILDWAARSGLRLLMSDAAMQRELEDKLSFDGFLREHGLPAPERLPWPVTAESELPLPAVLQHSWSLGGEGTFIARDAGRLAQLRASGLLDGSHGPILARRFVEGAPFGITVWVEPGRVVLSAIRRQCYYRDEETSAGAGTGSLIFAGIQWEPSRSLSARLRSALDETFTRLGRLLHARGFFGFANVDFMVDRQDRIAILECNPRMSAATPQLLRHPELAGGVDLVPRFLGLFAAPRPVASDPEPSGRGVRVSGLPESSFEGASLDLMPPGAFLSAAVPPARLPLNGRYSLPADSDSESAPDEGSGGPRPRYLGPDPRDPAEPGELCLFAQILPGERPPPGECWATALCSRRLYDRQGRLLPAARRLFSQLWSLPTDAA